MTENTINQESMLRVGTILHGTYRIDRYLSSGGFGNTYVATHVDFDETYAIKEFFMKGVTQRDSDSITVSVSNSMNRESFLQQKEKFKKEARRLRQLDSLYIVRVHDLFEENGTAYYVMDYVDGENLSERLKRTGHPMSEAEVNSILPQILDALKTVHDAGMWHLDLKPANIMLDKSGQVKLIDFGASKQLDALKGGATTSTAISYTNGYAPREQMEQNYDKFGPWTDIYALGATLYNLLTNHRPPMPTDIDDDRSEDKHFALPLPSTVNVKMRKIILWLMNTDRYGRPKSVSDIRQMIDEDDVAINNSSPSQNEETIVGEFEKTVAMSKEKSIETNIGNILEKASQKRSNKIFLVVVFVLVSVFALVGGGFIAFMIDKSDKSKEAIILHENTEKPAVVTKKIIDIPQGNCTYTGEVNEQGIPNGNGQAWFSDGRYYKGSFVNGNMHGDNAYFSYKEGDVFEGSFANNKFDKGKYTIKSSGESFDGSYFDGKPLHGKWFDKNGTLIEEI